MSNDGVNIVAALRGLRELCAQIALLLSSADKLMSRDGWITIPGGNVYGRLAYTLAEPRRWIQQDIFRFYKNPKLRHLACFVSVILDDVEQPHNITVPLLTAGFFDDGVGNESGVSEKNFNYSLARWHLNMPNRNDDGNLIQVEHEPTPKESFKRVATVAVPLLSITDNQDLQNKIITPLLQAVKEDQI
jgi:hypothetical protein